MSIKSPFNFVPAATEEQVYKPYWADQVSHDVPFEDGQSGEITLKITAKTPIFIRDGHTKPLEGETITSDFCHIIENGQMKYYIPATSSKGMIRNVLEIISFSKMNQINDDLHSIRQIIKRKEDIIKEGYSLNDDKQNILAGYLTIDEGTFYIYPAGKPFKIRYTELDRKFNNKFSLNFSTKISDDFDERTGAFKYEEIIKNLSLEYRFKDLEKDEYPKNEYNKNSWVWEKQPFSYVKFSDNENDKYGRIVCVGQASPYNVDTARKGEFVFWGKRTEILENKSNRIKVSEKTMGSFLFLNRDGQGKAHELKDWAYWKSKINEGIPIFYRMKSKNELRDFGLTLMYKEKVQNSTKDILSYYNNRMDLAETIFGKTDNQNSLKGRVFFSHFFAKGVVSAMPIQQNALTSPKSSYSPFYLEQTGGSGKTTSFNTYNVGNPKLRGFKRYPVRNGKKEQNIEGIKISQLSSFQPLPKDTVFTGKIRFHNLRKAEIGALISAITFHQTDETFHSIGSLKPFGYGRVKIEIEGDKSQFDEYLKEFEILMKLHNEIEWNKTYRELITMATINSDGEDKLAYMPLADFQAVKNEGLFLQKYSEIVKSDFQFKAFANRSEILYKRKYFEEVKKEKERLFQATKVLAEKSIQNDEFDNGLDLLKRCLFLNSSFDFNLEKSKLEFLKERKSFFDSFIHTATKEELENKRSYFLGTKWLLEVEHKISELTNLKRQEKIRAAQKEGIGEVDTSNFSKIKEYLNKPFKVKSFEYAEEQKNEIEIILKKNYSLERINKKSEWNKNNGRLSKYPWTEVTKWLGQDRAQQLYTQLTHEQ